LFSLSLVANPVPVAGSIRSLRSLLIAQNAVTHRFSGMGFASMRLIVERTRRLDQRVAAVRFDNAQILVDFPKVTTRQQTATGHFRCKWPSCAIRRFL
jgi:hypothetical protein